MTFETVGILDTIILAILFISTIVGIVRGFVKESLSIAAWVISIWASFSLGDDLHNLLDPIIESRSLGIMLSYGGSFFGSLLVCSFINFILTKIIKMSGFGLFDRMLGLGFGFARGALLISILVVSTNYIAVSETKWWTESVFIPYFKPVASWFQSFIPKDLSPLKDKTKFDLESVLPVSKAEKKETEEEKQD